MAASGAGTSKMVEKLEKTVEAGQYYEAQQMYKSVQARYLGQKKVKEALDLLEAGACTQLKHGQVTCGAELALLLVEALSKFEIPFGEEPLGRIRRMYELFPTSEAPKEESGEGSFQDAEEEPNTDGPTTTGRGQGCRDFLRAAIKWSEKCGGPAQGAPELHVMLADYVWASAGDLATASRHYLRADKPARFAEVLGEAMQQGYPSEADLVIARAVLQYLSLGNLKDANIVFEETKKRADTAVETILEASPLMHFIDFLLQTLERDALPLFNLLRHKYKPSLERDPSFQTYIGEIAFKFLVKWTGLRECAFGETKGRTASQVRRQCLFLEDEG
ncbi:hypothetical protein KFL_000810110 [Klebsormidium nitens]|uniref:Golgi to ER traffic protein 4 homolog n=1 Tax=Klebsormidium nitens TaxID=105231 RepID=A0A1Y1HS64_KLENI|nr:hypothetical protein KFL_000810110 [Klebsormidium nitens]|eukprot:GAQ81470.1 hypothetical protein KFL_000810110 [Klebsormidium nitens]